MEGKLELDEIWNDIKWLMDGMMVMVKDSARSKGLDPDELLELNKSSILQNFQSASSIPVPVACEAAIFRSLEAGIQVVDGAGQPSSLKLEGPKAAHNLFDKMPRLTSADGNEGKPSRFPNVVPDNDGIDIMGTIGSVDDKSQRYLKSSEKQLKVVDPWSESEKQAYKVLDELLIRVPVKNGDDVLDIHGFAGDSCKPHLRSIELHLDTLNPWGESESKNKNVDDFYTNKTIQGDNLYSELAEEDLVQLEILQPCQTAISRVDEVEKFFSWKIGCLEIGHHMFNEMPEPISAVRNKGTVVHGELIVPIVGLPRDLCYESEVTELNSFNISSKSKLEEVSMFKDIKNPELDVDFGVDGMLIFIFDPGGSFLFYNGCDHFESSVERGNYCLATNRAEFLNIWVPGIICQDDGYSVGRICILQIFVALAPQLLAIIKIETWEVRKWIEWWFHDLFSFSNLYKVDMNLYVTIAGLHALTYTVYLLYAWLGSNDFGYQHTAVQGVTHKNIQCYDCFKPSQVLTKRCCDIEALIVGLKKERLHYAALIFGTEMVQQSVMKQLHKLVNVKMVERIWKKFLEESESEKDKKSWALLVIDMKQLAMAICAHRLKTTAKVKKTRKNLFEGVVNAKLQNFVWDPCYRFMYIYILEDNDVLKRKGMGVRLARKQDERLNGAFAYYNAHMVFLACSHLDLLLFLIIWPQFQLRGRWGVFEILKKWVSGAYVSHTIVGLRDSDRKLSVGEPGHGNDEGEVIIVVFPWVEWWEFELTKDGANLYIFLVPLRPGLRAKFNETSAWEYARSMFSRPYGYHNLNFSWTDTLYGNYSPPLDDHFIAFVMTVWDQIQPAYAANMWKVALNKRLGTHGLGLPEVLVETAKHGFSFEEPLAIPVRDDWVYIDGQSTSCITSVHEMDKEAGLFGQPTNPIVSREIRWMIIRLLLLQALTLSYKVGQCVLIIRCMVEMADHSFIVVPENFVWDPGHYMLRFFLILEDKDVLKGTDLSGSYPLE